MPTTTVQIDRSTHERLTKVKHDMTFDEVINLLLDMVGPGEVERARELRAEAYEKWQAQVAKRIRSNRSNKRLF